MSMIWGEDEDNTLRRQFGTVPLPEIAAGLKRTLGACERRARMLGITIGNMTGLTPEQVKIRVRARYDRQAARMRIVREMKRTQPTWPRVTTDPATAMAGRRYEDAPAQLRRSWGDGHVVFITGRWARFQGSGCSTAAALCVG